MSEEELVVTVRRLDVAQPTAIYSFFAVEDKKMQLFTIAIVKGATIADGLVRRNIQRGDILGGRLRGWSDMQSEFKSVALGILDNPRNVRNDELKVQQANRVRAEEERTKNARALLARGQLRLVS